LWHPKRVALRKRQNEIKLHALTACRRQMSETALQISALPNVSAMDRGATASFDGEDGPI
jgi:hypothetical protein